MGENFYEVWLYARRAAARVRTMHGGSRAVVLPEVFSGQTIRLESLRAARSTQRKKNAAPVLLFRKKFDTIRTHPARKKNQSPTGQRPLAQ